MMGQATIRVHADLLLTVAQKGTARTKCRNPLPDNCALINAEFDFDRREVIFTLAHSSFSGDRQNPLVLTPDLEVVK